MTGRTAGLTHDQPVQPLPAAFHLPCTVVCPMYMHIHISMCVHETAAGCTAGKLPYMRRHGKTCL